MKADNYNVLGNVSQQNMSISAFPTSDNLTAEDSSKVLIGHIIPSLLLLLIIIVTLSASILLYCYITGKSHNFSLGPSSRSSLQSVILDAAYLKELQFSARRDRQFMINQLSSIEKLECSAHLLNNTPTRKLAKLMVRHCSDSEMNNNCSNNNNSLQPTDNPLQRMDVVTEVEETSTADNGHAFNVGNETAVVRYSNPRPIIYSPAHATMTSLLAKPTTDSPFHSPTNRRSSLVISEESDTRNEMLLIQQRCLAHKELNQQKQQLKQQEPQFQLCQSGVSSHSNSPCDSRRTSQPRVQHTELAKKLAAAQNLERRSSSSRLMDNVKKMDGVMNVNTGSGNLLTIQACENTTATTMQLNPLRQQLSPSRNRRSSCTPLLSVTPSKNGQLQLNTIETVEDKRDNHTLSPKITQIHMMPKTHEQTLNEYIRSSTASRRRVSCMLPSSRESDGEYIKMMKSTSATATDDTTETVPVENGERRKTEAAVLWHNYNTVPHCNGEATRNLSDGAPEFNVQSNTDLSSNSSSFFDMFKRFATHHSSDSEEKSAESPSQPPFTEEEIENAHKFLQRRQSSVVNVGAIKPELYQRKGQVLHQSSLSGKAIGRANITINYDYTRSDLVVTINKLGGIDTRITEYCLKMLLKPECDMKTRTTDKFKASSGKDVNDVLLPISFKFPVTFDDTLERRIVLQLIDTGRAAAMTGQLELNLDDYDLCAKVEIWADIEAKCAEKGLGEVLVQLNYLPSVQRLTVTIHEARDLQVMDITGSADPYVRVQIIDEHQKVTKKKKTGVRKNNLKPVWNEPLNFVVEQRQLKKCHLELCVMDYDLISADDEMGIIVLSLTSPDVKCQQLWADTLEGKHTTATWLQVHAWNAPQTQNRSD